PPALRARGGRLPELARRLEIGLELDRLAVVGDRGHALQAGELALLFPELVLPRLIALDRGGGGIQHDGARGAIDHHGVALLHLAEEARDRQHPRPAGPTRPAGRGASPTPGAPRQTPRPP